MITEDPLTDLWNHNLQAYRYKNVLAKVVVFYQWGLFQQVSLIKEKISANAFVEKITHQNYVFVAK